LREYISISEIIHKTLKNTKNSQKIKGETLEEHFQLVFILREIERKTLHTIKYITNLSIARIRVIIDSAIYKQMKLARWQPMNLCKNKPPCRPINDDMAVMLENYTEIIRLFDEFEKNLKKRTDDDE